MSTSLFTIIVPSTHPKPLPLTPTSQPSYSSSPLEVERLMLFCLSPTFQLGGAQSYTLRL